jgi:hypothetical protein|tara:strand:- start:277 stop:552 length:276 start_codon:yes stop_codon:yes gene_type:complete
MSKKKYYKMTLTKYDDKGKPIMKVVPSGIPGKSDTLYNIGTHQVTNKLTGEKSKKETAWAKKISPEEFHSGVKSLKKRKKKSGGYKKVVRK